MKMSWQVNRWTWKFKSNHSHMEECDEVLRGEMDFLFWTHEDGHHHSPVDGRSLTPVSRGVNQQQSFFVWLGSTAHAGAQGQLKRTHYQCTAPEFRAGTEYLDIRQTIRISGTSLYIESTNIKIWRQPLEVRRRHNLSSADASTCDGIYSIARHPADCKFPNVKYASVIWHQQNDQQHILVSEEHDLPIGWHRRSGGPGTSTSKTSPVSSFSFFLIWKKSTY